MFQKAQLTNKRLVETLINMYNRSESNIHEHILSAINVLIDDNPESLKQAREMKQINFKQILCERIALISSDPRHEVILLEHFLLRVICFFRALLVGFCNLVKII